MRLNRLALLGTLSAMLALNAASLQAFLFEDGSFETMPAFADGEGWEVFGDPDGFAAIGWLDWANGAPGTGGFYAEDPDGQYGLAFQAFAASQGGFYHDVPVTPDQSYDFHIQSHTSDTYYQQVVASGSGTVSITFGLYDDDPDLGGNLVAMIVEDITSQIVNGGTEDWFPPQQKDPLKWQDWDYTINAPAGASYLRATVQWITDPPFTVNNPANIDESVRWDNAELTTILSPLNDSQQTEEVLAIVYETRADTVYTNEATADFQDWEDLGLPQVVGNDNTQQVYVVPDPTVQAYRLSGSRASLDTIYSDENDGFLEVRDALPPQAPWPQVHPSSTNAPEGEHWMINVGEWYGPGVCVGVMPFQLPNFGAVADPFATANLGVHLFQVGAGTVTDCDLYAVRVDADPAIQTDDWYIGSAPDPSATLLQAGFMTPTSVPTNDAVRNIDTDAGGDAALADYLNSAYAGGTGAGQYVFLRLSYATNALAAGWDAYQITTRTAGFEGDWPTITFSPTVPPLTDVNLLEPAFVPSAVVQWDAQLGVHYEYDSSDDGGSNWTYIARIQGDGTVERVTDPTGPVTGRTYRVVVQPDVARVPGP